ncbi:MAG: hypothetical protein WCJ25_01185 [Candidatus Moraniibacteriota bacterium]
MGSFFSKLSAVVFVSLFGASILNLVSPSEILFPAVLFSIAVALSLSRGFVKALPAIVVIGLVADVATLGRIGLLAAFSVGLAYATSFFSRRFVVGHGLMTHIFSGLLIGAGVALFLTVSTLFTTAGSWNFSRTFADVSWGNTSVVFVVGIVSFALVSASVRRFEEWRSYLETPGLS